MKQLEVDGHVRLALSVLKTDDDLRPWRIKEIYYALCTLCLLDHELKTAEKDAVLSSVLMCRHESGGFSGNIGHDPHLLATFSAIQILALLDRLDFINVDKVSNYVSSLQNDDGSFSGDMWGEVDTRFSYCSLCCLSLLHRLDRVNISKAVDYIISCRAFDGGFGREPNGESHSGQIFCCVAALGIAKSLHLIDRDQVGWWLCERQTKCGGFNGRPNKDADVCYSWWVLSSLAAIDRMHWIDKDSLVKFILDCQDEEKGGISESPESWRPVDLFHTFYGVAGLSLLEYPGLKAVDQVYSLPVEVVNRILLNS